MFPVLHDLGQHLLHHPQHHIIRIRLAAVRLVHLHEVRADALVHDLLLGGEASVQYPERSRRVLGLYTGNAVVHIWQSVPDPSQ